MFWALEHAATYVHYVLRVLKRFTVTSPRNVDANQLKQLKDF